MIKAINTQTNQEIIVAPTVFPDKTSQIWKLPEEFLEIDRDYKFEVIWDFENENELIHVFQLGHLLWQYSGQCPKLFVPYLPYARQDKEVSNETTFALECFIDIMRVSKYHPIQCLDIHSNNIRNEFESLSVAKYIKFAIDETQCNFICFPDKGASQRNYGIFGKHSFCLEKERDQSTGKIISIKLEHDLYNLRNKSILIVDDICDGGWTFTEAAKILHAEGAKSVNLYVTHGIFSKGLQVLRDAGIQRIFTWKGEQ